MLEQSGYLLTYASISLTGPGLCITEQTLGEQMNHWWQAQMHHESVVQDLQQP